MKSKVLLSGVATCLALVACGNGGSTPNPQTGGVPSTGGQSGGSGGLTGSGGVTASGGVKGSGGTTGTGGGSGGVSGTGGAPASSGGTTGQGSGGATSTGGQTGSGGGSTATGGGKGTGGTNSGSGGRTVTATGGTQGAGGTTSGSGGNPGIDGGVAVNCSATMPDGGKTYTGSNVNGSADGLNYGIWTNGSGGSITVFTNAHAFSASWNNSQDFLAHLGLDFNASKAYTAYGTITANYVEIKSGTAGGFSMIGMYGWMHSPCVEWYINEDSFNGLNGRGSVTATIDGDTYYLSTTQTTGTGGANACEGGHTGSWTQMISTRQKARQCGTITVSDHFAAWAKQGWNLGSLASVHINVEVGGGTGSIQFPVAEVTTQNK